MIYFEQVWHFDNKIRSFVSHQGTQKQTLCELKYCEFSSGISGDQKNTSALLDLQLATEPCPFIDKSTNE